METPPVVRLANDIASQFSHLDVEAAAAAVAGHMAKFWDPRMRSELRRLAEAAHVDLDPLAAKAAGLLAVADGSVPH